VRLTLAAAALLGRRARTALAVLGVAVSAALLLDMVMLATGMRESFRDLLLARGYQLRLAPKGTLPFDSEATVDSASAVLAALARDPRITAVSPVLGGTAVRGRRRDGPRATAFGLGIRPDVQGDYERVAGGDVGARGAWWGTPTSCARPACAWATRWTWPRASTPRCAPTPAGGGTPWPAPRASSTPRPGSPWRRSPLADVQAMRGADGRDRVSAFMARVADPAQTEAVRRDVERRLPRVSAISTATALAQVEQRLSYFRQLAFILGAVSLAVGFLLVSTLVTVSVNERAGEFAVLRAVGVSRPHVVQQVVIEGLALSGAGALAGLVLGLVTARYLNAVLGDFPGLPAGFEFFVFRAGAAWRALGLLVVSGVAAGVYPAWRAASLPVARTLREEAVG
jgi:putative ABC transport system permease protein